ncbi:MAG: PKD domain-containing protein [Candidatus Thermoplasmatota archaeon]|nr:PKD domain-containing protein [Candidatus Thermoplasmatota archaeon]
MKKELKVLFVSIIICSSIGIILPTLSGHEVEQTTNVITDDCDCQEQHDRVTVPFGNVYRVMSNPIDCTKLQLTKPMRASRDLPEEFNWRDIDGVDWTTYAKEQGNCGSCWDFAAMGALESRIKISENCSLLQPDLSEQYVLSCLPAAANNYGQGCLGGTPYGAYYYILNTTSEGNYVNGIIPESCFPYQASHTISCDEKCDDWMDHLIPLTGCNLTFLGLGYATKENTDILKTILYEEGPIAVALNVTSEFINYWSLHHNPDSYFPDTHEPWGNRLNHIVVLVGWKDDPAIANGGYWIVKNSWGTEWGYDGFFNIEYYGLFFGMYSATASYDSDSVDWAPVADTGGLYAAEIGEEITFNGTRSIDPEGCIETYAWEFGDNTTGYGPTPTHTYSQQGIYAVTLTVTDSDGNQGKDSALVGVGVDPLLIDATGNLGIDIRVESTIDHLLTDLTWSVDISGFVLTRDTSGIIPALSNQQVFTHHIPLVGLGFGQLSIHVENIQRTERFFVLGPLVFGLRLQ